MKVLIFGASGMVGHGVLLECLDHPEVESVLALGRTSCGIQHEKLREILHTDFFDYSDLETELSGFDACFFCLGVSAAGMSEEQYRHLTHDLTLAAARTLAAFNPKLTFCYLSAEGADSSESGRIMWARVRGATENALLALPFRAAYMVRPGYIQPLRGVRSKTRIYRIGYSLFGFLYPIFSRLAPSHVTTSVKVGRAMISVGLNGYETSILETADINRLGG